LELVSTVIPSHKEGKRVLTCVALVRLYVIHLPLSIDAIYRILFNNAHEVALFKLVILEIRVAEITTVSFSYTIALFSVSDTYKIFEYKVKALGPPRRVDEKPLLPATPIYVLTFDVAIVKNLTVKFDESAIKIPAYVESITNPFGLLNRTAEPVPFDVPAELLVPTRILVLASVNKYRRIT
jgi:hypothetical protein